MATDNVPIMFYNPASGTVETEAAMDGQSLMQSAMLVRSVIDAVKSLLALRPSRGLPDVIPVYRLVRRRPGLLPERPGIASDLARMRWPR